MIGGATFGPASTTAHADLVHATRLPLIVLERHDARVDPMLLDRARRELLRGCDAEGALRSGFLLGMQADARTHPACLELARTTQARLLGVPGRERGPSFSLSFLKLAEGVPPPADDGPFFEGPHLDTHPELIGSAELLRLLVNLSTHPRRFLYAATDRWLLAAQGVRCKRREFEKLHLPPTSELRVIDLPGRTETTVHALRFIASAVPHVGVNDPPEHFLLSFEAVVDPPDAR